MENKKQENEGVDNPIGVECILNADGDPTCPTGYYYSTDLQKCILDVGVGS